MAYQHLISERSSGIERVTLNRPDLRNALNDEVVAELTHWAARVREHHDVRVAVLSGAGATFSAGADLHWMARMVTYSHEENVRDAGALSRMFLALDTLPVPLIGRIHGAAIGGGAGLAAVCDIVAAEADATFGFTEVKLGILPSIIAPYVLSKIGMSAARELFITGMRFSAARAKEIGLVHCVVPGDELDACVNGYIDELLTAAPEAISVAKELLRKIDNRPLQDTIGLTTDTIASRRVSAEGQDGMKAFLEKRKPAWNVQR